MKDKSFPRLLFLFVVREGYFLTRNLLGLLLHPYKTLVQIVRKRDLSQVFLILLLFASFWAFWALLVLLKILLETQGFVALAGNAVFLAASIFLVIVSFYLVYWIALFFKNRRKNIFANPKDLL